MMSSVSRVCMAALQSLLTILGPGYVWIVKKILGFIYNRSAKSVPPTDDKILLYTATALADKIRSRELTALKVMETYIARVKLVNPIVNAVVIERFDKALEEARNVDVILSLENVPEKYSLENMPFLGVPMSIKECFALAGYESTTGLVARKGLINRTDAPVVANIKAAGFIPFVLTNVSELCMWYESSNNVYGTTKNAYDTSRIVGGSSGGEACNISALGAVVGLGSDVGGSIRMPAFFNGIFGHKPSYGIVNNAGQHPPPMTGEGADDSILATGPLCRYASDLIPMLKVMAGPSVSKLKLDQEVDFRSMMIFTMDDMGDGILVSNMDPELKAAQARVGKYFQDNFGCRVNTVKFDEMNYFLEIWIAAMKSRGEPPFAHYMANEVGEINIVTEFIKWCLRLSDHTFPAIFLMINETCTPDISKQGEFLKMGEDLRKKVMKMLSGNSVLLFPSHPRIAPYHHQPKFTPYDFTYTAGFNALRLPVTQCPVGLSESGHPMGIQVVAATFNDRLSLAVAAEIERGLGGWVMPGR